MIHLILGGRRSGKTAFAEQCALTASCDDTVPLYIAPAEAFDDEMFGRGMAVILCRAYPISPLASLGRLAALPPQPVLFISIVFWLIPLWLVAGPAGLIAACLGGILLLWTGRIETTKLGGITGDIIGSAILLSETAFLIGLVGVLA